MYLVVAAIFYLAATGVHAEPELQTYHVDTSKVSVSGISSGGAMAIQYHVVHSREIMGAGIIAGAPFMCSEGKMATANICMKTPVHVSVTDQEAITSWSMGALFGNIDATNHMRNDKVFIFHGTLDSVVNPASGYMAAAYYTHYMSRSQIQTDFSIKAEHGMPTQNYGGPCDKLNINSYLNNCGYSAAFHLLDFIYGGLQEPTTSMKASGKLLKFDQSEFFHLSIPDTYSMDSVGYIYVPSGCTGTHKKCKLHIAFHGCQMARLAIGEEYVRHSGYNEVGELNNIIILYPQVLSIATNSKGCWDWFRYTGPLFDSNKGSQITAVQRMVNRIIGSSSLF